MQDVPQDRRTHEKDESPLVGWIAGIAAIAVAAAIVILGFAGTLNAEFVLWLDAAIIVSAVGGLVAWIASAFTR